MNLSALVIAITITFSPFAGFIAYVVSLDEYQHHFASKSAARKQALQTAIFTSAVFLILGVILSVYFGH
ncbi:MAG TPA: hypothetical protein VG895_02885 [Patescibacteria group bacterium]|nr:hypothetical protein [Patescibacteria group bacterium]